MSRRWLSIFLPGCVAGVFAASMRRLVSSCLALVAVLGVAVSVEALPLYGGNGSLHLIDPTDGSSVIIDTGDSAYRLGLAYNPQTGTMYSAGVFGGLLSTVNLSNGDTTAVGPPNGMQMTGLTFSADFSTLYSFNFNGGPLLALDPSDGSAVTIGGGLSGLLDLATDSAGTIYATGISTGAGIHTVNTTTGAVTSIGGTLGFTSIAFDENDTLYGVELFSDALYTINVSDGSATLIGGDIGGDVRGLAFIPEPSTAALLALGLVGLAARRRVGRAR